MSVYNSISKLAKLKQHVSFVSDDYSYNVAGTGKFLKVNHDSMNSIIVGNFDVINLNITPVFQHTGWWYDYMKDDSINVTDVNRNIPLSPGEYVVYTDKNLNKTTINNGGGTSIGQVEMKNNVKVYPNPAVQNVTVNIDFKNSSNLELAIYDLVGKKVYEYQNKNQYFYGEQKFELNLNNLPKGMYIIEVINADGKYNNKLQLN
jgi:hypothetical protein